MGTSAFVRSSPAPSRRDRAYELLQSWSWAAAALGRGVEPLVERDVARTDPATLALVETLLVEELSARLARAYEHGWEPRDLLHAASRLPRTASVVEALVASEARAVDAERRAPARWRAQLEDLAMPPNPWRPVSRLAGTAERLRAWSDLFGLVKLLAELVPLAPIGPRPSEWGRGARVATTGPSDGRDGLMAKIRALLAKAESTDHVGEAESFTAKAQELMTRHAIDEALVRGEQHEQIDVETRRVHLQAPYTSEKATLLHNVARANRCKVVLLGTYDIAMLLGTPLDVEQSEMLFTSLLIQATRAMAEAGQRRAGSFDRSATFRRAFLTAYGTRIGERLEEADRATTASYGTALVPLLQREADAVAAEFERQFPHVTSGSAGALDRRGWEAGRAAADRARLVAGQLPR